MKRLEEMNKLIVVLAATIMMSCANPHDTLFQDLDPESSGITFNNKLVTSDTLTVLDFEYLYNGGGVAIGDINNDGLQDVYFTGNMSSGKLYLNKGNLKFEDITDYAGVTTTVWCNGVTMVDINEDGFRDIFICVGGTRNTPSHKMRNLLFINQKNNTFKEEAATYGLQGIGYNVQSTFLDYDHDGDLDVYLLRNAFVSYSRNRARAKSIKGESSTTDQLYRNNGNLTFTDVSDEAGILIEGFGLGVQTCDLNNDNWPDIYVSNDFITNDLVYINNGNGTFSNKASQYLKHQSYNAMGCDLADFNNDDLTDIMVVDMLPEDIKRWKLTITGNNFDEFENSLTYGYEPQYIRNTLQINNGNGTFSDIAYLAGVEATDWSWSPLFADLNNDGLKDIFITNGYRQDITNLDFIKFSEQSSKMGTVEGNKRERLNKLASIPGIKVHNYLYQNNGDLTCTDKSNDWGTGEPSYSNGTAMGDLDNDGDLDLVVNNIDANATVLINTSKAKDDNTVQHYLRVSLTGPAHNRDAIGASIYVRCGDHKQFQYFTPFRGFLSSSEPVIHFGLGKYNRVDSAKVVWPDGKLQVLTNINADQVLVIKYDSTLPQISNTARNINQAFIRREGVVNYVHEENSFIDFKVQPLLPHMQSRNGPGIAVADVNRDQREDIFVGAAEGHQGALFVQEGGGLFKKVEIKTNSTSDEMGVLFFDADQDGDNDLYIAGGGNEHPNGSTTYQDHLYVNDGKGNFQIDDNALPPLHESSSAVVATDFDHDGDLDLFVGSRLTPQQYPLPASSHLLRNDSKVGKCIFTDATAFVAPALKKVGMVTAALWSDYNNDGWNDLIIAGEFMPISIYENKQGKTLNLLNNDALNNTHGWWNSIVGGDFDNDGDIDYIAGNLGLNSRYTATPAEPLCIYASDYDRTGSIDPVMSMYINHENQIPHAWDDLVKQMSAFRGRFRTYQPYAESTFETSFTPEERNNAVKVVSNTFETTLIINNGKNGFTLRPLPVQAQIGPVYGILVEDYNNDGNLDMLLTGNAYSTEASTGRYDAFVGTYLKGNGKMDFTFTNPGQTGFDISTDTKGVARIVTANSHEYILCAVNNGKLETFEAIKGTGYYAPPAKAAHAILKFSDGQQRKVEFYSGSGYLSSSSKTIRITGGIKQIAVYDALGTLIDSPDLSK